MVETNSTSVSYDYLILAAGSTTHFFGVAGAAEHAFALKTLDDAVRLRNHILCCFERPDQLGVGLFPVRAHRAPDSPRGVLSRTIEYVRVRSAIAGPIH